ncbi:TMAO reductase system periplasmic protein TorT [Roseovarius sp. M141]|uniref:TMAO reductase system periplasmic protein TorT n=1 Tax=Roseovarius sp. M141 TaxID=2583806 RepID=UPI0020CDC3C4|nr:TMAO reductase system periplasmic protein TorT [Roseovarius sp. M141]MCQ0093734.1 TMAO reductase system periplasmic protein TorT [Roseovarius sp. M141]
MTRILTKLTLSTALAATLLPGAALAQDAWFPYDAEQTEPAFAADGARTPVTYEALETAEKPWNICAALPHMKDAYWLGVDYGLVEEARRLGVKLNVTDAGGYTELANQISQIEDCVASGADAVIVGAISYDGLNSVIAEVAGKGIPVIDVINGVSSQDISGKALVSFNTMGSEIGNYLAEKHPAGSDEVTVGWFPGPAGAGWVEAANTGFMTAVEGSAVKVLEPRYGDTGKEAQLKLVEDVLQANPEVDYIAGTAVTAEAAQGVIRSRGLTDQTGILAFYLTPGVWTGIERGFITAAPADSMVIQARMAVDQAIRVLEGKDYIKHVGPKIFVINQDNIADTNRAAVLPPEDFSPIFSVE